MYGNGISLRDMFPINEIAWGSVAYWADTNKIYWIPYINLVRCYRAEWIRCYRNITGVNVQIIPMHAFRSGFQKWNLCGCLAHSVILLLWKLVQFTCWAFNTELLCQTIHLINLAKTTSKMFMGYKQLYISPADIYCTYFLDITNVFRYFRKNI